MSPDPQDFATAFKDTRERMISLMRAPATDTSERVPACPAWNVKELIAHVVGVTEDALEGNLASAGRDEWTEAQVQRNRDADLDELLGRWEDLGGRLDAMLATAPKAISGLLLADLVTHEHDLRNALGRPGERDSAGVRLSSETYARALRKRGSPGGAFELRTEVGTWTVGDGEPEAAVTASAFELFRAIGGRRTVEEIASLDWDGDPAPFIEGFSIFQPPDSSIRE